ncbi:MAG: bifunctional UDP-N-acetylglucosamine diphosphorylase/glucosamine-1-phosphate N-acetyltransferase GlmU [Hyphomicrobiaceae bacterium]|nr:bifunctional UDP-N-acetylglucosamine diphosphorylase/glucosamine-1-phosphate N-acetyltransferase GlmU [Hyphomicrobiaceae bacterium]
MASRPLLTIVLAAGKGTRMKSAVPKVLHRVGGLSLLGHALRATGSLGAGAVAVVIGPDMEAVRSEALALAPGTGIFVQDQQLGTAHAVLAARAAIAGHSGDVLVVFADTPLIAPGTLRSLVDRLDAETPLAVLGFEAADPTGYGRLLCDAAGGISAIREHKDATEAERALTFCCSGVMAFRREEMLDMLGEIGTGNVQGEYYLTDAVAVARSKGFRVAAQACAEEEVLGINSRNQLAMAEAVFQRRFRDRVMAEGATLVAPETVWFSHDTLVGRDVTIEPNVFFGPGVIVEDEVRIHANCHLEGAHVRRGAAVGPFARLRPGADLGTGVRIGNFVEVKNVTLEAGAKANHLAYLGDGRVGAGANVGAGTIFCNYDGFLKHRTEVGPGAFIGSNSALVAPVSIGPGAYVGSGSVVTRNVPADALALERSELTIREGWAAKFRAMMQRRKSMKSS